MRRFSMATKQRRWKRLDRKWALLLAKRAGLGVSGALNGAFVAACLVNAGVSFFDPVGTAAALMIFGWMGGFIGVEIEPPVALQHAKATDDSRETKHPGESLSAGGTLIANSTALIAAWLFLSNVPPTILWVITIGFWWVFGVTLQIAAGALVRLRAVDPGIA